MVTGLQKYAGEQVRRRASSPKLQVFNTALVSAQSGYRLRDAQADPAWWERLVASAVGAHLVNAGLAGMCQVYYWRDRALEVDFVVEHGRLLTAIEVKSATPAARHSGLEAFRLRFAPDRVLLVGGDGIGVEEFLAKPVEHWVG